MCDILHDSKCISQFISTEKIALFTQLVMTSEVMNHWPHVLPHLAHKYNIVCLAHVVTFEGLWPSRAPCGMSSL